MGSVFSIFIRKLTRRLSRSDTSSSAGGLELTINNVDYAPANLDAQTPFTMTLVRMMPGQDRPDYWLAHLHIPLTWIHDNHEREITHLILAARWQRTQIERDISNLPVAIAYVTDQSLVSDVALDFSKCAFVAIGLAHDTTGGRRIQSQTRITMGTIARQFGTGNP